MRPLQLIVFCLLAIAEDTVYLPGARRKASRLGNSMPQLKSDIYSVYGEFLNGSKLDVGRRFYDLSMPDTVNRIEYLRVRSAKKKVLHVGCLDHPEVIRERIKNQTWLHGIISASAALCVGIDVDVHGIDLVNRELDIENIHLIDLSASLVHKDLVFLRRTQWDLILCPEVLEHITNHQQFLQNLRKISHSDTTLIVTVPNAFKFGNFVNAFRGFESINSDHKYWFTFYTLSRTLAANAWKPRRVIYYNESSGTDWMDILSRIATRTSRVFCDGLVIEATGVD
jgi:2-polyprenyl-3-methyl-5-hydroxy-6-metoxy-1,4-benzoquinol methylase